MNLDGRSPWLSIRRCAFLLPIAALLTCSCCFSPTALGQQTGQAADALRQAIVGQTLTVKVPGIHAATRVLVNPIDNRIVNGAVQKRGIDLLRGSGDFLLQTGAVVRVVTVEAASDRHGDLIRIAVNVPGGGYSPIAFVLDRGVAGSLSPAQLAALISPVLSGPALEAIASSGAPAAPAAAVASPSLDAASQPPVTAHPANTIVDFPPAALGPALHASAAAQPGCWWDPWLSQKFHLDMLMQHCASEGTVLGWNYAYFDNDQGISVREPGAAEPLHLFDIVTKNADQALGAAIQQKFIASNKDATLVKSPIGPTAMLQYV